MEGAAVVDLAERGVLSASGPDRQKFLHRILSQEVLGLVPGEGRPPP